MTVVLKVQLYSMYECVWCEQCLCVCTDCMCDVLFPGNGHSFPLMYPVKDPSGPFIASGIQRLSIC